ncbi:hypothetical protein ACQP3L_32950, partial [Escherichia coli]
HQKAGPEHGSEVEASLGYNMRHWLKKTKRGWGVGSSPEHTPHPQHFEPYDLVHYFANFLITHRDLT